MGSRKSDPMRQDWFIDGYASERSRTIEPSQADGGFYLKLMASCLRVTVSTILQLLVIAHL